MGNPVKMQPPNDEFDRIVEHMGEMAEELLKKNFFRNTAPDAWRPAMNIYEGSDRYVACLELSGMDRESIDIEAGDGVLYVRGERERPMLDGLAQDISVHLMEIDSGRFQRKVPVPRDVDADRIRANYRNGYLWIVMPRRGCSDAPQKAPGVDG